MYHKLEMIAAMNSRGLIGTKDGKIPWHVPEDMEHFRETTKGGIVIMGRKTWESLPAKSRPLSGRINIIMTREPFFKSVLETQTIPNVYIANGMADLWELLDKLDTESQPKRIFIIGGGQIYQHFMPICEYLYLTEVNFTDEVVGGTYFPLKFSDIMEGHSGWVPKVCPKDWAISHKRPYLCYRIYEFVSADSMPAGGCKI